MGAKAISGPSGVVCVWMCGWRQDSNLEPLIQSQVLYR